MAPNNFPRIFEKILADELAALPALQIVGQLRELLGVLERRIGEDLFADVAKELETDLCQYRATGRLPYDRRQQHVPTMGSIGHVGNTAPEKP